MRKPLKARGRGPSWNVFVGGEKAGARQSECTIRQGGAPDWTGKSVKCKSSVLCLCVRTKWNAVNVVPEFPALAVFSSRRTGLPITLRRGSYASRANLSLCSPTRRYTVSSTLLIGMVATLGFELRVPWWPTLTQDAPRRPTHPAITSFLQAFSQSELCAHICMLQLWGA
jgi:hypothetical protein